MFVRRDVILPTAHARRQLSGRTHLLVVRSSRGSSEYSCGPTPQSLAAFSTRHAQEMAVPFVVLGGIRTSGVSLSFDSRSVSTLDSTCKGCWRRTTSVRILRLRAPLVFSVIIVQIHSTTTPAVRGPSARHVTAQLSPRLPAWIMTIGVGTRVSGERHSIAHPRAVTPSRAILDSLAGVRSSRSKISSNGRAWDFSRKNSGRMPAGKVSLIGSCDVETRCTSMTYDPYNGRIVCMYSL